MQRLRGFFGLLGPIVVLGGLGAFVYYALVLYPPHGGLACQSGWVAQQADIAVHVIRQWAGREGQEYTGCQ